MRASLGQISGRPATAVVDPDAGARQRRRRCVSATRRRHATEPRGPRTPGWSRSACAIARALLAVALRRVVLALHPRTGEPARPAHPSADARGRCRLPAPRRGSARSRACAYDLLGEVRLAAPASRARLDLAQAVGLGDREQFVGVGAAAAGVAGGQRNLRQPVETPDRQIALRGAACLFERGLQRWREASAASVARAAPAPRRSACRSWRART